MAVNLFPNADIETSIAEWELASANGVLTWGTTRSQSGLDGGTHAIRFDTEGYANAGYRLKSGSYVPVDSSTQYTISFYVWVEDSGLDLRIRIRDQDLGNNIGRTESAVTAGQWNRLDYTFTTASDTTAIEFTLYQITTTVDTFFDVDCIMLETGASASTWVNYSAGSEILVVADCAHAHTADSPVITQGGSLTVADCAHAHTAVGFQGGDGLWDVGAYIYPLGGNEIVLETNDTGLSVADCAHAHTVESPTLTQLNTLVVNDAAHIVAADSLLLGNIALSVDDAFHSMSAQNVTLTGPGFPSPDDGSLFIPFLRRKRRG